MNIMVDKYYMGQVFIKPGHTHTLFYQDMNEASLCNHIMQLNELLAQKSVTLNRAEKLEGEAEYVDGKTTIQFQGV